MITTIITTYQRPFLLKRAINSVLKQTFSNFQVCVYDNASGDETTEIMKEFLKKDSRVKYHRHARNIGMMENYEFAYSQINAPFFSFLSDDDFLLPNFYETALEGLQKFPEAAFSACGVVQLDEKGNYVGDPLSLWGPEELYLPPKGVLEMIKTRCKFPVPTGVLFRHKFVKSIKPDFSKDIELYWDPDYLLRIAASFPIIINKKSCGIYLAHSQSFSNSVYMSLVRDFSVSQRYLTATHKIISKIEKNDSLSSADKKNAKKLFNEYIKGDVISFFGIFIKNRELKGAHILAKQYYHFFGFSLIVFLLHMVSFLLKWFPFLRQVLLSTNKFYYGFFAKKYKKHIFVNQSTPLNNEDISMYYNYGKELLDIN